MDQPAHDDIRRYLASQTKADLVELLMGRLLRDDDLRQQLTLAVARAGRRPNVAAFRDAIARATDIDDRHFIGYDEAYRAADPIDRAVEAVAELLDAGYAAEAIDLADYALRRCDRVLARADDSGGSLGLVMNRAAQILLAACRQAPPEPAGLARRVFALELELEDSVPFLSVADYADVLGPEGIEAYAGLVGERWDAVPATGPGEQRSADQEAYVLSLAMEWLARRSGDPDDLAAVLAKDLSSPSRYGRIVKAFSEADRPDDALRWAEEGFQAFGFDPGAAPLVAYICDAWHAAGRRKEAMGLAWREFEHRPGLEAYRRLEARARRVGEWPAWRRKALSHVETEIGRAVRPVPGERPWAQGHADHSLLVEIHLYEGDVEMAWQEARTGGCGRHLWIRLAKARERDHPQDAVEVYREEVHRLASVKEKSAYREATALMRHILAVLDAAGRRAEFPVLLAAIREAHRRKRTFVQMLSRIRV